jgi:hypothetical protein
MNDRQTHLSLVDEHEAHERFKRQPWPIGPANHAHRYSTCSGPCERGRKPCPTPGACECAEERPPSRSGDLLRIVILVLACWAAVAATLIVTGVTL